VNGVAWSASAFELTQDAVIPNRWVGVLQSVAGAPITSGTEINFKVTRGTWATVEMGPQGANVPNRVSLCGPSSTTVFAHVFHWADDQIYPPVAYDLDLGVWYPRALNGVPRQIYSHMPPGYSASSTTTYPVLYALNGQTMYAASRSPSGVSVQLDVAGDANAAVTSGTGAFISVAIDASTNPAYEFGPTTDPVLGGGGLPLFGQWLFEELMPEINRIYQTQPGTSGILGTGLAGLAAFQLAWDNPDRLQLVGSMSPMMTWDNEEAVGAVTATKTPPALALWLDVGTGDAEGPLAAPQLQAVQDVNTVILGVGLPSSSYRFEVVTGGTADETSWQARLPAVLNFLFP
jgi:predicted alpha/beta superfamily hydrolase